MALYVVPGYWVAGYAVGDILVGNLAATESGADTAAISGSAPASVSGSLAASESGADTAMISASSTPAPPNLQASLAATESGQDVAVFVSIGPRAAVLAVSESQDTAFFDAREFIPESVAWAYEIMTQNFFYPVSPSPLGAGSGGIFMATGSAWSTSNPLKPVALFDPNAIRDIPFEWSAWLADIGSSYQSHTVIAGAGLECPQSSQALGTVKVRVQKDPLLPLVVGQKYPITCRIVAANGEQDDQTVWLKITEK